MVDKLAVAYTPYSAIFDRNGKEVKTISGDLSQEDLDTYLVKAMIVGKKPGVVQVKKLDGQLPAKMAPGKEMRVAFNKLATH